MYLSISATTLAVIATLPLAQGFEKVIDVRESATDCCKFGRWNGNGADTACFSYKGTGNAIQGHWECQQQNLPCGNACYTDGYGRCGIYDPM
jgi:hypothetical protein